MKKLFVPRNSQGLTYYIDTGFAWIPMYIQGQLIFMRRYWVTWPEDDSGAVVEMYKTYFPYDPSVVK